MAVTIYDVARFTGVSVKTVSRAINDHPDVSPRTRGMVLEAAQTLGFRPNPLARGLSAGATGMIGLIVPEILNPHYAEWARAVEEEVRSEGYMLVLSDTAYDTALALAHVRTLIAHRAEGLIWMAGPLEGAALDAISAARLPTVVHDTTAGAPDHIRTPRIAPHAVAYGPAMRAVVTHLLALGHTRIAYITEQPDRTTVQDRLAGFQQTLLDHGTPADPALIRTSSLLRTNKLEGGYQETLALLAAHRYPTAICTSSDLAAIGILRALREQGLRVPKDVSVVGCDDLQLASYTDPPLTTIHTPYAAAAQANFRLLLHLIDSRKWPEPLLDAEYTLVVRESTGPVSTGRPRPRRDRSGEGQGREQQ